MKTGLLSTLLIILSMLTYSCASNSNEKSDNDENEQNIDFAQFDYIGALHFAITRDEITQLLPHDKKLVGDKEEGFAYDFVQEEIEHHMVVLTYGAESFTDLTIELDFSKHATAIEKAFMYINKHLENRFEAPVSHAASSNQETITWIDNNLSDNQVLTITLTKYDKLITVNYHAINNDNEDYGGAEGEWVQRGPNGEWIFVPY